VVVALGGDGTVNEVVNGLLTDGAREGLPLLAVVPGGSTNVFARMLGLPQDPVEATGEVLDGLRSGRSRAVGLGRAGDRWFTFNAGFGFDAEVVRRIERRRQAGESLSHSRYVRRAVRHFFKYDRRHPAIALERPGEEPETGLYYVLVANAAPWTYLHDRPINLAPEASFDTGLDVFAPRTMRTVATLRYTAQAARRGSGPRGRRLLRLHDVGEFTLRAARPMALQTDGDYLGEMEEVRLVAVPAALRVVL
jgi:diacylglycerol kinase family enzyme